MVVFAGCRTFSCEVAEAASFVESVIEEVERTLMVVVIGWSGVAWTLGHASEISFYETCGVLPVVVCVF